MFIAGDLVLYRNTKPGFQQSQLGVVLCELREFSVDHRFFRVLLNNGVGKIISDHYLVKILPSTG